MQKTDCCLSGATPEPGPGGRPPSGKRPVVAAIALKDDLLATEAEAGNFSLDGFIDVVEERLRQLFAGTGRRWASADPWLGPAIAALADFVLQGGKRLRPMFCAYGFKASGGAGLPASLVDISAALEILHSFALLHDDVMDGSLTRRGRPSLQVRFMDEHVARDYAGEARRYGEGTAVLLGDLAFALAQSLMTDAPLPSQQVWHELSLELVMGQYLDIAGAARGGVHQARALRIARYKSGAYTVERPLQLGATAAGLSAPEAKRLFPFARPLGEAFQLRDDLLSTFGDEKNTGKPAADDLRQGKPTVLLAVGREMAGGRLAHIFEGVGRPGLTPDDVAEIRSALVECGARRAVETMVRERFCEALVALEESPITPELKPVLRQLAERALWRAA